MEILIRLELELCLHGDKVIGNEDAIRECVYSYLEELIEDDSLAYEIKGGDEPTPDKVFPRPFRICHTPLKEVLAKYESEGKTRALRKALDDNATEAVAAFDDQEQQIRELRLSEERRDAG